MDIFCKIGGPFPLEFIMCSQDSFVTIFNGWLFSNAMFYIFHAQFLSYTVGFYFLHLLFIKKVYWPLKSWDFSGNIRFRIPWVEGCVFLQYVYMQRYRENYLLNLINYHKIRYEHIHFAGIDAQVGFLTSFENHSSFFKKSSQTFFLLFYQKPL